MKIKNEAPNETKFKYYFENELINFIYGLYIAILSTVDLKCENYLPSDAKKILDKHAGPGNEAGGEAIKFDQFDAELIDDEEDETDESMWVNTETQTTPEKNPTVAASLKPPAPARPVVPPIKISNKETPQSETFFTPNPSQSVSQSGFVFPNAYDPKNFFHSTANDLEFYRNAGNKNRPQPHRQQQNNSVNFSNVSGTEFIEFLRTQQEALTSLIQTTLVNNSSQRRTNLMKTKPLEFPQFNGEIVKYINFKQNFQSMVDECGYTDTHAFI